MDNNSQLAGHGNEKQKIQMQHKLLKENQQLKKEKVVLQEQIEKSKLNIFKLESSLSKYVAKDNSLLPASVKKPIALSSRSLSASTGSLHVNPSI
jgi:chromosome segregation ATPase